MEVDPPWQYGDRPPRCRMSRISSLQLTFSALASSGFLRNSSWTPPLSRRLFLYGLASEFWNKSSVRRPVDSGHLVTISHPCPLPTDPVGPRHAHPSPTFPPRVSCGIFATLCAGLPARADRRKPAPAAMKAPRWPQIAALHPHDAFEAKLSRRVVAATPTSWTVLRLAGQSTDDDLGAKLRRRAQATGHDSFRCGAGCANPAHAGGTRKSREPRCTPRRWSAPGIGSAMPRSRCLYQAGAPAQAGLTAGERFRRRLPRSCPR